MAADSLPKNGKNAKPLPTADEIRRVLDYDPLTGLFYRKVRTSNRIKVGSIAGGINKCGYRQISVNGVLRYAHRLAMVLITGKPIPDGIEIDHVNMIKSDNREINLRLVTPSQQHQNVPIQSNNTLGFQGIKKDSRRAKPSYIARIKINGKEIYSTSVRTIDEAIALRKDLERRYHTHAPGKQTTETLAHGTDMAYNTQRTTD